MDLKNTIKSWAKDDRPREKLVALGAENLSNSELLAILIHGGTPKRSALDLAKELLQSGNNDLNELGKFSLAQFKKIKGIGEAKAVTIAAALELGRRRHAGVLPKINPITSSMDIANYLKERLKDHNHEVFGAVFLNQANKILGFEVISKGGITGTVADPKVILKRALEKNAVNLILCHNHPSGSLKPSKADEQLTEKIKQAAAFLDMKVLDHIIVSDSGYYSFADEGMI